MTSEGLRPGDKKPLKRKKAPAFLTGFMDLTIGAGNEVFQVTARFRFGGKSSDPGQIGRGAFIKKMETPGLIQGQTVVRGIFPPIEHGLQFVPKRPLVRDKSLQVDDHK